MELGANFLKCSCLSLIPICPLPHEPPPAQGEGSPPWILETRVPSKCKSRIDGDLLTRQGGILGSRHKQICAIIEICLIAINELWEITLHIKCEPHASEQLGPALVRSAPEGVVTPEKMSVSVRSRKEYFKFGTDPFC